MAHGNSIRPDVLRGEVVGTAHLKQGELTYALGHDFANRDLLNEALTHPSVSRLVEGRRVNYERLEFLGDRVLGLAVAQMLLQRFPMEDEGKLAQRFSGLVRRETLARVAEDIGLARHIHAAKSEVDQNHSLSPTLLGNCCEAVIGALFLDAGWEIAARFIDLHWTPYLEAERQPPKDAKTELQEWAQARGLKPPSYDVTATEGPGHDPRFTVRASIEGVDDAEASATGGSKRMAEQRAAEALLGMVRAR